MGRLTKDPELRRTQSGLAVTSFSLACERDYKDQQGNRETDFINCVAWRSTAEFVQKYFPKGRMATVTGRLQVRSYTDRDGNKRTASEVVVDNVYFGESKRSREDDGASQGGSYGGQSGGYPVQAGNQARTGYAGYQAQSGYGSQGSYQGGYQNGSYQGGYQRPSGSVIDNQFSDLSDDDDGTLPF